MVDNLKDILVISDYWYLKNFSNDGGQFKGNFSYFRLMIFKKFSKDGGQFKINFTHFRLMIFKNLSKDGSQFMVSSFRCSSCFGQWTVDLVFSILLWEYCCICAWRPVIDFLTKSSSKNMFPSDSCRGCGLHKEFIYFRLFIVWVKISYLFSKSCSIFIMPITRTCVDFMRILLTTTSQRCRIVNDLQQQ